MRRLHLTPNMLEAGYDLLRMTPPFNRWKLPAGEDVEFHVVRHIPGAWADHQQMRDGRHRIRLTSDPSMSLDTMLQNIAHEMVHVYEAVRKEKAPVHNKTFWERAG